MKNRLKILFLVSFIVTTKLYSQDAVPSDKIFIGVSVGRANTTFVGSEIDERLNSPYAPKAYLEPRKGLVIGIQSKITFHKYLFIRPGLTYIQKGAEEKEDPYALYAFKAYLDYISMPLLVGVQPLNFDNVRNLNLYVEAGIVPNFEVSRKNSNLDKGYSQEPEVKSVVLSYQLGAGLELKVIDGIALFGNYSYFRDLGPFFSVFENPPHEAYNKGTSISVGVMVDVNKFKK